MSMEKNLSAHDVEFLLSTEAIRKKAKEAFDYCTQNNSHFVFHPGKIKSTVDIVLEVIKKNYPDLNIPFHSRWGHFRAGGKDRTQLLKQKLSPLDPMEQARCKLDLVITSVLLDAGAGSEWRFTEEGTPYSRSEGLGIASFHMFLAGALSENKSLKVDSEGLHKVSASDIENYFQVSPKNPLVGVEGRVKLLNNFSEALLNKKLFKDSRPGNILDYLNEKYGKSIPATGILRAVLDGLGPIWPGRIIANGMNLGDVWEHSSLGLVPIHKLSQWMTYSLIEPIQDAGFKVTGVQELTGLAEYRNGGLMIDSGILTFKNDDDGEKVWGPESDLIIEWRALTIYLLDLIADGVRAALGKSPEDFPLAKVLEGGTWWAGRKLAQEKRPDATPPIHIRSDGTVF